MAELANPHQRPHNVPAHTKVNISQPDFVHGQYNAPPQNTLVQDKTGEENGMASPIDAPPSASFQGALSAIDLNQVDWDAIFTG